MIHLFLDDSGKDGQQTNPWVCMAGYLADYDATVSLIGKWRQLLIAHGIREIHMKHLIPLTEPYKDLRWDSAKRDSVVNDFIQAINETRMAGRCGRRGGHMAPEENRISSILLGDGPAILS